MADGGGGAVIIKGGSVRISFDGSLYLKDALDPNTHKHQTRKITRVLVSDENGGSQFDSGTNKDGLKWTNSVHLRLVTPGPCLPGPAPGYRRQSYQSYSRKTVALQLAK